jgi:hypothetical protein
MARHGTMDVHLSGSRRRPSLIIEAVGVIQLIERPRAPVVPLIVIGVGAILLLTRLPCRWGRPVAVRVADRAGDRRAGVRARASGAGPRGPIGPKDVGSVDGHHWRE